MTNRDKMYRKKGRALFLSAMMVLSVVALSSAFAGSAAAAVDQRDTERIISNTEVTNGTTVTVTVNGAFTESTQDAQLDESISGAGITDEDITITSDNDADFAVVTSDPAVDVTYNDQLGSGLGSDNFTVEYEVTIPEDTPVGTTITFDGNVTDNSDGDTAAIGGDTQIEVVEQQQEPPTATVEFTDQTVPNGSTSVNVASATFDGTESFNVVVHQASDDNGDGTIQAGEIGTKIGESAELNSGTQTDITVDISKQVDPDDDVSQLTESQTLVAMLHTTNTNDGDNIVHAAPITRDGTPVFDQAEITVQQQQNVTAELLDNDNLTSIIENGGSITQDVSVTNDGSETATPTVSLVVEDTAGNQVDTVDEATPEIPPDGGDNVTLSGTVDVDSTGEFTLVLAVDGIEQLSQDLQVTAPGDTGAITGDVRRLDGSEIENVQQLSIQIFRNGVEVEEAPTNSPVQPDADGEYTAEVPVADDGSTYQVQIAGGGFNEFSRDVTIQPQATERVDIRLDSAAAKVGVGLFDSEQQEIVGDTAALLADGDFDGPVQLAVYAQAEDASGVSTRGAPPDTTADITVENLDNLEGRFDVDEGTFLNPNDPQDSQRTLSIDLDDGTISANSIDTNVDADATISNSNGFDTDGTVSLGVFNVTSGDVTRDDINALESAVARGDIRASIDEEDTVDGSASISDTSDLIYFIEGEKSTQHQVLDTDGNPIEGATVFISYRGAPQNLEDVEDFQNNAGESFLTAESNENGIAVIPGLVPDVTYNVYVKQPRNDNDTSSRNFNIFNSSTAPAAAGTLSAETNIDPSTFVADYTLDQIINSEDNADGSGFSEVYAHTLRERPQEYRLNVTVANDDGTQVKSALVPPGDQRNVQVRVTSRPIDASSGTSFTEISQEVTLELTNLDAGGLDSSTAPEVTVTTNENGTANTTFESSVRRSANTNVTASTRNANDVLFETNSLRGQNLNDDGDQAEINVAGTLTGDVRDEDEELIRDRNVSVLLEKNGRLVQNTTIDQGQYNFENLETGEQYRVIAEFQNESGDVKSGFAQVNSLAPGTNTRDIVVQGVDISNSNSPNSPLDPPAAEYDQDGDGDIDITELGQAGQDFAQGELTIGELGQIGQEFAS